MIDMNDNESTEVRTVDEMDDREVNEAVLRMAAEDRQSEARELMGNERTFAFGDQQVTATEYDWFEFFTQVADECQWAVSALTYADAVRMLREFGMLREEMIEADNATRRQVMMDHGLATTDAWRDPCSTWRASLVMAEALSELGYFDSPIDKLRWMMTVDGAPADAVEALSTGVAEALRNMIEEED